MKAHHKEIISKSQSLDTIRRINGKLMSNKLPLRKEQQKLKQQVISNDYFEALFISKSEKKLKYS